MTASPRRAGAGWLVLIGTGLLVLGGASIVIQLVNFYSMGLDLKEQTEWALCSPSGPTGDGGCTPQDAVPSDWPFYLGAVSVVGGVILLLAQVVYDMRAHARQVSVTSR